MAVIGYYLLESIVVIGHFRCEICTRSIHLLVDGWNVVGRLAREGGVKRMSGLVYEETRFETSRQNLIRTGLEVKQILPYSQKNNDTHHNKSNRTHYKYILF
jgi:hypothetical protein